MVILCQTATRKCLGCKMEQIIADGYFVSNRNIPQFSKAYSSIIADGYFVSNRNIAPPFRRLNGL